MTIYKCFKKNDDWGIHLCVVYEGFAVEGLISKEYKYWDIYEPNVPSTYLGWKEITLEEAEELFKLIDNSKTLVEIEREMRSPNTEWCYVIFSNEYEFWHSVLMPYLAYKTSVDNGAYQHSDYEVYIFPNYEEALKSYNKRFKEV